MKLCMMLLLIAFTCCVIAQKPLFVRIYDSTGNKIAKGRVLAVTDTSIQVSGISEMPVSVKNIGSIKTKHSAGNNLIKGAILGGVTIAFLGAVYASDTGPFGWTVGEGISIGGLIGIPIGTFVGAASNLFKESKTVVINGDTTKWKDFQLLVAR